MASGDCMLCGTIGASLEQTSHIILAFLNSSSGVLSVTSNLLVLIAIYNYSPLRKVSSFFITSLAAADLLVGLLMNPINAALFIIKATERNFYHPLIVAEHCLWVQTVVTSTFTLTAVSIERYIAVRNCFRYFEIVTVKRCVCCVASIWIFSITYASFRFSIRQAEDPPSLWMSTTILTMFLPFFIILYRYIRVFKAARHQCGRIASDSRVNVEYCREVLKNKKAAWTLRIVIGLFILLWMPSFAVSLWDISTANPCDRLCINYMWFQATLLSFASSFCKPWVYAIRMREFRLAFLKVLHINTLKVTVQSVEHGKS